MEILLIMVPLVIVIIIYQYSGHKKAIESKVEEVGGQLIEYKRRWGVIGIGPFKLVGKGQTVYSFTYEFEGETKEGWVKFGRLFGPDWRM